MAEISPKGAVRKTKSDDNAAAYYAGGENGVWCGEIRESTAPLRGSAERGSDRGNRGDNRRPMIVTMHNIPFRATRYCAANSGVHYDKRTNG